SNTCSKTCLSSFLSPRSMYRCFTVSASDFGLLKNPSSIMPSNTSRISLGLVKFDRQKLSIKLISTKQCVYLLNAVIKGYEPDMIKDNHQRLHLTTESKKINR